MGGPALQNKCFDASRLQQSSQEETGRPGSDDDNLGPHDDLLVCPYAGGVAGIGEAIQPLIDNQLSVRDVNSPRANVRTGWRTAISPGVPRRPPGRYQSLRPSLTASSVSLRVSVSPK